LQDLDYIHWKMTDQISYAEDLYNDIKKQK